MAVTRSDTPFHCSAPGKANFSVTIVSATVRPAAGSKFVKAEQQEEQRRRGKRAGDDADDVADRLLARLCAEHVARLDVHQQVGRVARHLRRT